MTNWGKAFLQDLPTPNLPFIRASFGANFTGALAHPQLYSERLPFTHVAALHSRGPNMATLHHSLSVSLPGGVPPEVQVRRICFTEPCMLAHSHPPHL